MTHKRQLLRHGIADLLGADPRLKGRVQVNRSRRADVAELPAVAIYALQESSTRIAQSRGLQRSLTVAIEIRAAGKDLWDDLDALCEIVERIMAFDPGLKGTAGDSALTGTDITLDGESEARQAVATLRYTVTYQTDGRGL